MQLWENLASRRECLYAVNDFRLAAYTLMSQQALYASERLQSLPYRIISEHLHAYQTAFDLFGMEVIHDATDQYVVAIPRLERRTTLPLDMTLMALTLRQIFHESSMRGETEAGAAIATIEELAAAHESLTGRAMTNDAGTLRGLLDQARRMGMVRLIDADDGVQPYDVKIMPAIVRMIDENVLMRLAGHYQSLAPEATEEEAEADPPTVPAAAGGDMP
jgi:hypothetical protein